MTLHDDDDVIELSTETISQMSREQLVERLCMYKRLHDELSSEFDEYKTSSTEMEEIMDKELAAAEKGRNNAESEKTAAVRELRRISERYEVMKSEACSLENTLRAEVSALHASLESAKARVRQLEQANDDLERRDRYNTQMMDDLTRDLERTIERAAFLESELAEMQFQSENAAKTREEQRAERPRVAVEPLKVERPQQQHEAATPDDTPESERKAFAALNIVEDHHMEVDDVSFVIPSPVVRAACAGPVDFSHISPSTMHSAAAVAHHHHDQYQQTTLPPTPESSGTPDSSVLGEDKSRKDGFKQSINRIVRDLLQRVDRVESILTNLKTTSHQEV